MATKNMISRIGKLLALMVLCAGLSACEDPQVYGSIGVSSYGGGGYHGGYGGGPRMGGSVRIGGRIY
jgi:hypothetical protein